MKYDDVMPLGFICLIFILVLLIRRLRSRKYVFITDYQRGVRFRNGAFNDLMPPGGYYSYGNKEQITIIDLRPQPILIEQIFFQDVMQARSVISIGGELSVEDPLLAVTKLKNPVSDSINTVRDTLRLTISKGIMTPKLMDVANTAEEIKTAVNSELSKVGMVLSNLEITEMWTQSFPTNKATGAN